MTSRTVLFPAAMPPPSSSSTGPRSGVLLVPLPTLFSSEKISYNVWNLRITKNTACFKVHLADSVALMWRSDQTMHVP